MEAVEIIKKYNTKEIIKLLKKHKLNISLEQLLINSINCNRNDLAEYLINNQDIDFDYQDYVDFDCMSMAVSRGNIEIIDLLKDNGVSIFKKYKCDNKTITLISFIRDLPTLKYFEGYFDSKVIKRELSNVIRSTVTTHNIELLDYILKNYKINIKKIKYNTQNKKYSILEITEEVLNGMKNREYRKREMTFYIDELLSNESNKYKKIIKRAYSILKDIELENKEIENYFKYLKQYY